MKQKSVQMFWLKIIALNLFLSMFIGTVRAEPVITSEPPDTENTFSSQNGSENTAELRNIVYNVEIWATFSAATRVYYAPYASGNAPTEYTMPAGSGAFVRGRVYDYYYIYWYINEKIMFGYVPISSLNVTGWIWINYDHYKPATCSATTTVLSGPGTTNTYFATGTIFSGEAPLMVLGQYTNEFNNKIYYYVQYELSNGLVKRGWVDSTLGTVRITSLVRSSIITESDYYAFINASTNTALTWNSSSNVIKHQAFTGALNQLFRIDIQQNESGNNTYYSKIIPLLDETKALRVASTGYAEGLTLTTSARDGIDKRQEFCISTSTPMAIGTVGTGENSAALLAQTVDFASRSTGYYRALSAEANGSVQQKKRNESVSFEPKKMWRLCRIGRLWDGTYGQNGGNAHPGDFYAYYDYTLSEYFPTSNSKQQALNVWNSANPDFSLVNSSVYYRSDKDCLALITSDVISLDEEEKRTLAGKCNPVQYLNGRWIPQNENYVNQNWYSTEIILNIDLMEENEYQIGDIRNALIHELGHALKLSHSFYYSTTTSNQHYETYEWMSVDLGTSIMNPTSIRTPQGQTPTLPSPTVLDIWRLSQKWDNIS